MGAGHYMRTHADFYDNGGIAAWTRTESVTWFGGYVGTVAVIVYDKNGFFIDATPVQAFGVNGTAWGGSDRTDTWYHTWDAEFAARAAGGTLLAVHSWRFDARALVKAAEAAKTLVAALAIVA
ncbi:hypothetical protein [Arthrobacter sp. ISL-28]|uniref:hypothetical protein n=1 Tax=Arthrobacter sp. ISL-28 TaxID=2819108 RepID=UPI001BE5F93E|nr:hypothetical protein [Arthrobacter sp. ISL-28]MBT2523486.1 hypothetical protein [Arthrobacter sp. ISL-28]